LQGWVSWMSDGTAGLTWAEITRLHAALLAKWENMPGGWDLDSIIGTTISDTLLVVEGTLTPDFEFPSEVDSSQRMMQGIWPSTPGTATHSLEDDEQV